AVCKFLPRLRYAHLAANLADGFNGAEVRGQMRVTQSRQEFAYGVEPALEHKAQDPAKAAHLFARDAMLRVAWQSRVKHATDLRLLFQKPGNLQGAFVLLADSQVQ